VNSGKVGGASSEKRGCKARENASIPVELGQKVPQRPGREKDPKGGKTSKIRKKFRKEKHQKGKGGQKKAEKNGEVLFQRLAKRKGGREGKIRGTRAREKTLGNLSRESRKATAQKGLQAGSGKKIEGLGERFKREEVGHFVQSVGGEFRWALERTSQAEGRCQG